MEYKNIEQEVIGEMMKLMEKSGFESFPAAPTDAENDIQSLDATLINIRNLAARYDKQDAITQVRSLMEKYNIQVDELMEIIRS